MTTHPQRSSNPDWVLLAAIATPHGVKGRVKVKSFTDPVTAFAQYTAITDAQGNPVKLKLTGEAGGMPVVEIEGLHTREHAELWRGKQLGVTRDQLPKPKNDRTFYAIDLVGMAVTLANGTAFGRVTNVANFGAGDLLEILQTDGKQEFFAFTDATFPDIDTVARRITIHPPHILGSQAEEEGLHE